ncbi:MAG: hypothetical protein JO327_05430, partial [Nitrososphaeraceae archaeon]|nr:hypothetical protein [Nitrososphaeraceae archaeon]
MKDNKKVTVLLSTIGLLAVIVSLTQGPLHSSMAQQQQQQQNTVHSSTIDPPTSPSSLANVFKRVENSVVQITSTRSNPNDVAIINGVPATGKSTALGSGFVYDNQG